MKKIHRAKIGPGDICFLKILPKDVCVSLSQDVEDDKVSENNNDYDDDDDGGEEDEGGLIACLLICGRSQHCVVVGCGHPVSPIILLLYIISSSLYHLIPHHQSPSKSQS